MVPSTSGLSRRPFKAESRVQIPLGLPYIPLQLSWQSTRLLTALSQVRVLLGEPYADVAQLAEQSPCKRQVAGSTPVISSRGLVQKSTSMYLFCTENIVNFQKLLHRCAERSRYYQYLTNNSTALLCSAFIAARGCGYAEVAPMVEQLIRNQLVVGSSPAFSSNIFLYNCI